MSVEMKVLDRAQSRIPQPWRTILDWLVTIALAVFDPYLFTGGDNVRYYALAKALATGRGYVDLITPGTPTETIYPPGFALLLVPFYWIFGGAYVGLLGSPPASDERTACVEFLTTQAELLKDPKKLTPFGGAEQASVAPSKDPRQRARENLVHVLLNHHETIHHLLNDHLLLIYK